MPVYRYRDVSEMEDRSWHEPGDPALFRAIRAAWDFARRTTRLRFPPGVHKHRSLDEADALRESWERANFAAFRKRRAGAPLGESEQGRTGLRSGGSPSEPRTDG